MDAIHLHLMINHLPVTGMVFGVIFLSAGIYFKSEILKKIGLWTGFVLAVLMGPVYVTGERAEDAAEQLPGVTESLIEPHEEAAELALFAFGIMGGLSLLALLAFRFKPSYFPVLTKVTLLSGAIALLIAAAAANSGGEIRHPEIRPDYRAMPAP